MLVPGTYILCGPLRAVETELLFPHQLSRVPPSSHTPLLAAPRQEVSSRGSHLGTCTPTALGHSCTCPAACLLAWSFPVEYIRERVCTHMLCVNADLHVNPPTNEVDKVRSQALERAGSHIFWLRS